MHAPPGIAVLGAAEADDLVPSRDSWAREVSPNKDVKIYIGAPGAKGGAGGGYVDIDTLSKIAVKMRQSFPSFGGIMLWDASQAYGEKLRLIVGFTRDVGAYPTPNFTPSMDTELIVVLRAVLALCSEWEI